MQISDKIAFLRKKKGWSQEQLAIKLDVSRQAVYKWEANITYPEIDKLKKLASLFEISFNDFFDDSVDITKKEESKAGEKQQNPVLENNGNVAEISVDKKAPGEKVQEATRTTPKSEADYTVKANQERNRIIALIVTLIVGIIACVTIGIVAFLSVTSGNEGTPQDPPSDNVGGENGGGEQQQPNDVYYSVTCRVLGEIYKVESVLKGEAYTPDNIQVGGYTFGGWLYKGELWTGGAVTKDMVLNAVLTPEENLVVFILFV